MENFRRALLLRSITIDMPIGKLFSKHNLQQKFEKLSEFSVRERMCLHHVHVLVVANICHYVKYLLSKNLHMVYKYLPELIAFCNF